MKTDEIGSKMTGDYVKLKAGMSVCAAMSSLIEQAAYNDNVSTIYVVDEGGVYYGAIYLGDLIRARENTPLDAVITKSHPYVYSAEPIDKCIDALREYAEDSIPVLDSKGRLAGILTAQGISEIYEDEIGDDYAKLGGLSSEDDLNEPLGKSVQKRLPWLCALFFMGLTVSGAVGAFEQVVAGLTVIVSFQSLILGMAGNAGTQSLAVTIRALLDERQENMQSARLIRREACVGALNGLFLGSLSFASIGLYLWLVREEAAALSFSVSLCTGASMCVSMLLSSVFGTAIPILLKKIKIDPAVASGPFITTVNDLVAVVIYYGLSGFLIVR